MAGSTVGERVVADAAGGLAHLPQLDQGHDRHDHAVGRDGVVEGFARWKSSQLGSGNPLSEPRKLGAAAGGSATMTRR